MVQTSTVSYEVSTFVEQPEALESSPLTSSAELDHLPAPRTLAPAAQPQDASMDSEFARLVPQSWEDRYATGEPAQNRSLALDHVSWPSADGPFVVSAADIAYLDVAPATQPAAHSFDWSDEPSDLLELDGEHDFAFEAVDDAFEDLLSASL
jgi:hypothetical protein